MRPRGWRFSFLRCPAVVHSTLSSAVTSVCDPSFRQQDNPFCASKIWLCFARINFYYNTPVLDNGFALIKRPDMQQQCRHCHNKYSLTVAKLLMNVKCFHYKWSRFVFLLLPFHKFLKPNQHFALKKTFPFSKKVQSVPFDDEHCATSLLLFRIGCLKFVFPCLSSQLALASGVLFVAQWQFLSYAAWQLHWIAADKRAVGWSSGSDSANKSRGCGGYIAAPRRTKWILRCRFEIAKCEYELRQVCLSVCPSVRPSACPNATARIAPDGFSRNFNVYVFFRKSVVKM